jgi:hypothetical protein
MNLLLDSSLTSQKALTLPLSSSSSALKVFVAASLSKCSFVFSIDSHRLIRSKMWHSVNVFYHVNQERHIEPAEGDSARERAKQEKEFRIGSIGLADSSGILLASLLAIPTELKLCKAQLARGRTLCREL